MCVCVCSPPQAYADYHDVMAMTEELLRSLCLELHGDTSFHSMAAGGSSPGETSTRISFEAPFKRYDFIKTIEVPSLSLLIKSIEVPSLILLIKSIEVPSLLLFFASMERT